MPRRSPGPAGLGADLASFVGRRAESSQVRSLLAGHRLVTLTGPGGVGKTRLGLRVAARLRRTFPDGVHFVGLSRLQHPLLLDETVLQGLGVLDLSARPAMARLAGHVAGRRLLLVLDNCEHLRDGCRRLVDTLLRASADVRVLATSREPLRVPGEAVLEVPPMSSDEAVELFEQRARAVTSGFAVTAGNRDVVVELCRRLDDLPLAIELAAAWSPTLSPQQVLDRLDDRFRLLTRPGRAGDRHATLEATVRWSAQTCSHPQRLLWARASVLGTDFGVDAAEQVCADEQLPREAVTAALAGLADKSILRVRQQGGAVRYRWAETVRAYGLRLLAERGEEAALRRRHLDWCLALARPPWVDSGLRTLSHATVRLTPERDNLRAALEYSLTEPGQAWAGLDLAGMLVHFWLAGGTLNEGRHWLRRALAAHREPTRQRARALWAYALIAIEQGDTAEQSLDEARDLAGRLADGPALAWAISMSGYAALYAGDLERARPLLADGVSRHHALGLPMGESAATSGLAQTTSYLGDPAAEAISEQHLALADRHDWAMARAIALRTLGLELVRQRRERRATEVLREALRTGEGIGYRRGTVHCLDLLAWAAAASGRHDRAARLFGAAAAAYQRIGATVPQPQRQCAHRYAQAAEQALGAAAFRTAYRSGEAMTDEQAVSYALSGSRAEPSPKARPASLTRREEQVARLIGRGRSNKEIAADLVVSVRTAESHVGNIMAKLAHTNRAQVAAWAERHLAAEPRSGKLR